MYSWVQPMNLYNVNCIYGFRVDLLALALLGERPPLLFPYALSYLSRDEASLVFRYFSKQCCCLFVLFLFSSHLDSNVGETLCIASYAIRKHNLIATPWSSDPYILSVPSFTMFPGLYVSESFIYVSIDIELLYNWLWVLCFDLHL